ncbi:MAG: catalase family peroxidase [Actinomycetospora chiangmaiensis]|nr:catalase family peroxidase [Actinomycetospora chiangmaiensis]
MAGRFAANGAGARVSKAGLFAPGQVTPVLGWIALAGGQPYAADAGTTVRSLALLFRLSSGEEWRTGMNNIPVFPVRTPEAFYAQLRAAKPDPATGKPDPDRMAAFFAAHPESARAAALIKARTVTTGFADSTFRSLNAFRFVAADGSTRPVRRAFVPERTTLLEAPARADRNALFDAFAAQLREGPQRWHLVVTLGRAEAPTADATQPWPADREGVDVGTLTLTEAAPEVPHTCRDINFDPLVLPGGIAPGDDPLLSARSAAYAQSFTRRAGEAKAPSAVTGTPIHGAAL